MQKGRSVDERDSETVITTQAYRFALDPTPTQERMIRSHAGAARFAWNWALVKCQERYKAEGKWYTAIDLHRLWNAEKKTDPSLAWWSDNSKSAYQEAFRDLQRALSNFVKSKKGERKGRQIRFPRFKKRGRSRDAYRLSCGRPGTFECLGTRVKLPRLGWVGTYESTRKLARRLANGTARIKSASVSREAHRWHVSFCVEVTRADRTPVTPSSVMALDLGIKHLAVLSTGEQVPNPKHHRIALRKLRRLSRAMDRKVGPYDNATGHRRQASKRHGRAVAVLGRAHRRVANLRRDGIHKLTSRLARTHGTIVVEDLNVSGMLRNRNLARAVSDAGLGEIRRQLAYKTEWNGGHLIVADRWFPSSKTCSGCGAVKAKLALSERIYACDTCGTSLDRDHNAALNLAALARKATVAASGAETLNGRGADQKTPLAGQVAVKRQPGAALAGQTGTVALQSGTFR